MKALLVGVAALFVASGSASAAVLVVDFENSNVGAGNYSYAADTQFYSLPAGNVVSVPGVTFAGASGVQNNAPAWGFPTAPAPGSNAAFLQSYPTLNLGVITIDTDVLVANQLYTVTFQSVARPSTGADPFTVSYNSTLLGTVTPGSSWATTSFSFVAVDGQDLIFSATRIDGDHASGLDNITISVAVPEPSTWAMMILGFAGIGFLAYRRRDQGGLRLA
jgi:hypothetical protein